MELKTNSLENLVERNAWLLSLINSSVDSVCLFDARTGNLILTNHKMLSILDKEISEVRGKHFSILFEDVLDLAAIADKMPLLFDKGQFHFEELLVRTSSNEFKAGLQLDVIQIENFKLILCKLRKIEEKSLKTWNESEGLKMIFNDSPLGLVLADINGKIIRNNYAFRRICSCGDDFDQFDLDGLIRNITDKKQSEQIIKNKRDNRNTLNEEALINAGTEGFRWVKLSLLLIRNDNNELNYYILSLENIQAEKNAQLEARNNEDFLKSISSNLNECIYRSSVENGLVFANEAFINKFGYGDFEEMKSQNPESLYANEKQRQKVLNQIQNEGIVKNHEVQFLKKDGSTFWGILNSSLFIDEKGIRYIDGVITDISKQKKNNKLLKAKNRDLAELNKQLDSFVSGVSHDLRAPLMSLLGLLEILKRENKQDQLFQYFDLMEKSINKLNEFINEVIEISRNSKTEVRNESIDLEKLINDSWNNLLYIPESREINFKYNLDVEDNFIFKSDPTRLRIILSNLLSNAVRYHNYRQEYPEILVHVKQESENLVMKIIDNGSGIRDIHKEKIFDMFYRGNASKDGSGIGLYLVQTAVEKLDGNISLESEIGKGSSFTVSLPFS